MSTPLPQWQADQLASLLDALGGLPVDEAQRESLMLLAGFDAVQVNSIAGMIRRARLLAVPEAQGKQFARERSRQSALCQLAGVDPGDDPLAALIRHLRSCEREAGR